MRSALPLLLLVLICSNLWADPELTKPLASADLVFEETGGFVAVEAEHFFKQEKSEKRAWYLTTADQQANLKPDADPHHVAGAGGGAYLEILPDTRKNHGEKLINGENFINAPGKMAVLSYKLHFNTPGKYYVWARTHSTGTEDNGLHVGLDGTWPPSGQRMQWTAKRHWAWGSKQRTEKVHGGVKGLLFLKVEKAGEHIIQFSMREDGFEFDAFIMTTDPKFAAPAGAAPPSKVKSGKLPAPYKLVAAPKVVPANPKPVQTVAPPSNGTEMNASNTMSHWDFPGRTRLYLDEGKWLAVNPAQHKDGSATGAWPFNDGTFDLTLHAVGENDGQSSYELLVEGEKVGEFTCPLGDAVTSAGPKFNKTFKGVRIDRNAMLGVNSKIGSKDGVEFSRARWSHISVTPADGKKLLRNRGIQRPAATPGPNPKIAFQGDLFGERGEMGDGSVKVTGELKQWHKVTLTLDGPFAHEKDNKPNPFTDYRFSVEFEHESGEPEYVVPGYFAADGKASETSAESGTKWRVHFSPEQAGKWSYRLLHEAVKRDAKGDVSATVADLYKADGEIVIAPTDKTGRDLRGKGRLQYVGKHHLRFAGNGEYFLKAGADAPETFLGYADFDGTYANNPRKVPLKIWKAHLKDWKTGDPSWKDGKGKGMIGAINYLSGKGCNVFSFLPYNAGGDGDNVWPFISRDDKFHYDCSKLDQWAVVFEHATTKGMYLHFKLQETENDDNVRGGHKDRKEGKVPTSLDGGDLGPERRLYCRELIARFGHNLALNWNLGEENTQTTKQQREMAQYLADTDPYDHLIVVHTYPNQQDKIYRPLLGKASVLRGASLQNSNIKDCHKQVVKWTRESAAKGVPWVIGFDEPGTAGEGMPPDPSYPGTPKNFNNPSVDDTRKYALWGTIMAGGSGVEYYFGYKLPQNDLICEDWRSRDLSWDYCRIALEFFQDEKIPFWEMESANALVGNKNDDNSYYCYAKKGEIYLVYLPNAGSVKLDLAGVTGEFVLSWFNPRKGGPMTAGQPWRTDGSIVLEAPDSSGDWLAVMRR